MQEASAALGPRPHPWLALSVAALAAQGATLPLVGLFYLAYVPATIAEATLPEERW